MPFYRFRCIRCNNEFKELLLHREIGDVFCPQCGYEQVEKFPAKVGIQYKANGFYSTRNREGEEKDG